MAPSEYTLEDTELALRTLALTGTRFEQALQLLKEHAHDHPRLRKLPKSTLQYWARKRHADRFEEIRTEVSRQVADRVANQAEEIALRAGELELELLEELQARKKGLESKDIASALRNVTTTKSLNIDKVASPLRERPTVIHQDRTADDILQALKALEPNLIIDSTAEEIPNTQQPALPPAAPTVIDLDA